MKKIAFFDTKKYDIESFNAINTNYELIYYEDKLNSKTAVLAKDAIAVCAFVNDDINKDVINKLYEYGVKVILLRCAGYNNVDVKAAFNKIHVLRVPAYSPNAVAEHAMALLLCLNRKIHKAYLRTRDFNFNIAGFTGFDLKDKTIGVIGTGKIGQELIHIAKGFKMNVLAYDPYPNNELDVKYVSLDDLLKESDIITLHCPLNDSTKHIIDEKSINKMKDGVIIINTSRGALIESKALLAGLQNKKIKAAGLDVYEEESNLFFEDNSDEIIKDDVLSLLISLPNVIITSHQGYLTNEALLNIAEVTLQNLDDYLDGKVLKNEICYHCLDNNRSKECLEKRNKRCF